MVLWLWGALRKTWFLFQSYSDYIREFTHSRAPPPPMPPYGPPVSPCLLYLLWIGNMKLCEAVIQQKEYHI